MWACCQHTQHLARLQVRRRQQFENRQDEKKRRRKELYMKRARYALVVCGAALVVVRANLLYECTTCCTMCEQLTSVCIHTHHHAHASGNASTGHRRTTRWWAAPSPHPLQTCLATPMTSLQRYVLRDCLAVLHPHRVMHHENNRMAGFSSNPASESMYCFESLLW